MKKEELLKVYRTMKTIRSFEERCDKEFMQGNIPGFVHLYAGQEAVAVGACASLRHDDYITGNHRSHGHPIAKVGDVNKAMAELLGKSTGYCKGKGGSMHLADFSIGILGESGIVASALPVAVGAAMGSRMQGHDRVVVSFFGDGASNQGACHEAMNLAAIWKLPVIFLCENNQYAVTTHFNDVVAVENISDRAAAYNMPGILVDGQDVIAVHEATAEAVSRARAGDGPSFIEALTYRYEAHSEGLERILRKPYRTEEELNLWKQKDPIEIHKQVLIANGISNEEEIAGIHTEVVEAINGAVQFARESPYPEPEDLLTDMYADPIHIS